MRETDDALCSETRENDEIDVLKVRMLPERIELDEEVLLVECIDWRSLEEYSITIVLLVVEEMVELVENDDGLALLVDIVNEMDETDETEVLDEIFKYISEQIVIDEQFFV